MTAPLRLVRDIPGRPGVEAARDTVRDVVRDLAVTRYGAHLAPGSEVGALEGLRAARLVQACANRTASAYVAAARADGVGWQSIAVACGLVDPDGPGLVFAEAAGSVYGHITYRCAACGALVDDYGPDYGPPGDAVDGHAPRCRLAGR